MPLGDKLRELRDSAGLSQAELAVAYGVSQSTISQLEHDRLPLSEQRKYQRYLQQVIAVDNGQGPVLSGLTHIDTEGPRLFTDDALVSKLPEEWQLIGVTRCGANHELAFVYGTVRDTLGFVAFYRNSSGELKRTSVVPFEPLFFQFSGPALMRFLAGQYANNIGQLQRTETADDDEEIDDFRQPLKKDGWEATLLHLISALRRRDFTIDDVYEFEDVLHKKFPNHRHIRSGIRLTLQRLRDRGYIDFRGGGRYYANKK